MKSSHTGTMPWDEEMDRVDKEYQKLFPPPKRRFTFTEIRKKYRMKK